MFLRVNHETWTCLCWAAKKLHLSLNTNSRVWTLTHWSLLPALLPAHFFNVCVCVSSCKHTDSALRVFKWSHYTNTVTLCLPEHFITWTQARGGKPTLCTSTLWILHHNTHIHTLFCVFIFVCVWMCGSHCLYPFHRASQSKAIWLNTPIRCSHISACGWKVHGPVTGWATTAWGHMTPY